MQQLCTGYVDVDDPSQGIPQGILLLLSKAGTVASSSGWLLLLLSKADSLIGRE